MPRHENDFGFGKDYSQINFHGVVTATEPEFMTKVIIISDGNLDSFYEQTLQYLHDKYHNYPTSLSSRMISEFEESRISSQYENRNQNNTHISPGINLGKAVF